MGVDVRSFYSGRKFSCLIAVLLALVLSVSISLNAQSGSSPQSQPAQRGLRTAVRNAIASTGVRLPCSNGRPILKRGAQQPALPPCPDPPMVASPRLRTPRTRTCACAESLRILDRTGQRRGVRIFREASQLYLRGVHDAVYPARPRRETRQDVVSAEIIYDNGHESYQNVKINDRPTDRRHAGTWRGLVHRRICVHPAGAFSPRYAGPVPVRRRVFDFGCQRRRSTIFEVRSENSHWRVSSGSQTFDCGVTEAPCGWIRKPRASCESRCRPATCHRISRWIRSNPRSIIRT